MMWRNNGVKERKEGFYQSMVTRMYDDLPFTFASRAVSLVMLVNVIDRLATAESSSLATA